MNLERLIPHHVRISLHITNTYVFSLLLSHFTTFEPENNEGEVLSRYDKENMWNFENFFLCVTDFF